MMYCLYNTLLTLARPGARIWLSRKPELKPLVERFKPPVPRLPNRAICVQACSVGEVNTARPLVRGLEHRFPRYPVLVTSSTVTGHTQARNLYGEDRVTWFPFDTRASVRHFLGQAIPHALVLVETELWPNILREASRANIPVVIVNGRISDKAFARYRRHKRSMRKLLACVTAAGMQSEKHRDRIISLGLPEDRATLTGNLKFDAVPTEIPTELRQRIRRELHLGQEDDVLVFGSTRPGDEELAAACWQRLQEDYPNLRLVVVPRHVQRAREIQMMFGEFCALRSALARGEASGVERVVVVDTVGELHAIYSCATVAVVGGSFSSEYGGHNPLEPAALGIPTIFGPEMEHFEEAASMLQESYGAVRVLDGDTLYAALNRLLADSAERRQLGTRARRAVLKQRGAAERNVELVARVLTEQQH
jgi:3-deoxy-D-manno-octulosonic-acid transferase